jgi:hypothetical protein
LRPASVEFSINGGTDWLPMGTASAVTTLKSQVVTCDLSDCIVRSTREESNRPSDTAGIAEIRFVELGAGGYATLGNGVASLRGEVGEAWWIRHPFPGIDPMPGEVVFVEGSEIMVGLDVRHVGVEPTDVIEIVLRDEDTATEWVILSIDPEDVTADWQRAVRPWVSPAVIAGTLFIYIRTESTEGVQVDKAMPSPGAEVRAFARHHGEPGGAPDARTGRVQGFEPGGFPAVKPKFSLLIGGLI